MKRIMTQAAAGSSTASASKRANYAQMRLTDSLTSVYPPPDNNLTINRLRCFRPLLEKRNVELSVGKRRAAKLSPALNRSSLSLISIISDTLIYSSF